MLSMINLGLLAFSFLGAYLAVMPLLRARRFAKDSLYFTSRFPLFAVRDELVGLIASGAMEESDPAWKAAYSSIRNLLDLKHRADFVKFLKDWIGFQLDLCRDEARHQQFVAATAKLEKRARDIPEFQTVLEHYSEATLKMYVRRTSSRLKATLFLFRLRCWLTVLQVRAKARELSSSFPAPSSKTIAYLGAANSAS